MNPDDIPDIKELKIDKRKTKEERMKKISEFENNEYSSNIPKIKVTDEHGFRVLPVQETPKINKTKSLIKRLLRK